MKLKALLTGLSFTLVKGNLDVEITKIEENLLMLSGGELFPYFSSPLADKLNILGRAIRKGVRVVVVSSLPEGADIPEDVTVLLTENVRMFTLALYGAWYHRPPMKIIGITGTKGKTTTSYMIRAILEKAGYKVAHASSSCLYPAGELQMRQHGKPFFRIGNLATDFYAQCIKNGADFFVAEITSADIQYHRVDGLTYDIGVFTNISLDHISPVEHRDFEDYGRTKAKMFDLCHIGIINGDDPGIPHFTDGHIRRLETFGTDNTCTLYAENIRLLPNYGRGFRVSGAVGLDVELDMPGMFNVYNALAAISVCRHYGVRNEDIRDALLHLTVKGRMEEVPFLPDRTVIIDYAHNRISVENALKTLRERNPKRIICVASCDGLVALNRRHDVGEACGQLADLTVLATAHCRTENPMKILQEMEEAIRPTGGKYVVIPDRVEADRYALSVSGPGDVIILMDIGHERYLDIGEKRISIDEWEIVRQVREQLLSEGKS